MEGKNNKTLFIGIAAVVVVIVAVVIGLLVGKGKTDEPSGDNGGISQNESGFKASELANVDVTVEYGDYDSMWTLSKAIQNGEMTGKVVKIDGLVSHPGSLYSVIQRSEDGTKGIGTQFIIEGESEYPEDEEHIVITGKVVEKDTLYFVIKTLPEFIEVKED